jgi:hypothetical protein
MAWEVVATIFRSVEPWNPPNPNVIKINFDVVIRNEHVCIAPVSIIHRAHITKVWTNIIKHLNRVIRYGVSRDRVTLRPRVAPAC